MSPKIQKIYEIVITEKMTVQEAIENSGLLHDFPYIDLSLRKVGIYGMITNMKNYVHNNDRIEIYRPLLKNPKEARTIRAERKRRQQNLKSFEA